jgi:hypothetical protein
MVGVNSPPPFLESRLENASRLSFNRVFKESVDPVAAIKSFHVASGEPEKKATVLTDDFAPTEFLDAMKDSNSRR